MIISRYSGLVAQCQGASISQLHVSPYDDYVEGEQSLQWRSAVQFSILTFVIILMGII